MKWCNVSGLFQSFFCILAIFTIHVTCSKNISEDFNHFWEKYESFYKDLLNSTNQDGASVIKNQKYRHSVFLANIEEANRLTDLHKNSTGAKFGVTKFSALTDQEFFDFFLRAEIGKHAKQPTRQHCADRAIFSDAPDYVDWRTKGVVTAVKNQKKCGGCWAFSSVETVESMAALSSGAHAQTLSVQQTIDCAEGALGCSGGDVCAATYWMQQRDVRLVPEAAYPLTDTQQLCRLTPDVPGVHVTHTSCDSFVDAEATLLQHLYHNGPVAATVDATVWKNYQGGIIMHHCGGHLNHAVQIVGYSSRGDVPYYIVRNSWGEDFGIDGYLYIAYGGNVCDVASRVSSVIV